MSPPRIAIIAALPAEIRPLVRGWQSSSLTASGRRLRVFQRGRAWAAAGGMGAPAQAAARALIESFHPEVVLSAGWAGSLRPEIKRGDVLVPEVVIDAADGRAFRTLCGAGTLVSASEVVAPEEKPEMAARFSARAVDMEAATVAAVAQETTTKFLAVKAIFDQFDFALPPVGRFRSRRGGFRYGRFLAYAAVRPGIWPALRAMRHNAAGSASALCAFLEKLLACDSLIELQQQVARHALGVVA